jgi:hypothetical protein
MVEMTEEERERALKSRLTPEFLATLTEAARTAGWTLDHVATYDFVQWCHNIAGVESPSKQEVEPYT